MTTCRVGSATRIKKEKNWLIFSQILNARNYFSRFFNHIGIFFINLSLLANGVHIPNFLSKETKRALGFSITSITVYSFVYHYELKQ
jgi:hypothetical protein